MNNESRDTVINSGSSLEEKLQYVDKEIRMLHDFCVKSGHNQDKVQLSASPFFENISDARRKRRLSQLCISLLIVTLVSAMVHYDPTYRVMVAVGRKASVNVLSIWDWTQIYNMECLVENPFYGEGRLNEEDCQVCDGMKHIQRVQNVSKDHIADHYLKQELPVLVEDGMRDWPDQSYMSVKYLSEVFRTDPVLRLYMGCGYVGNIKVKYGNHREFLKIVSGGEVTKYYAHWENCFRAAAKAFRRFYRRPYFLPPVVELSDTNWIFVFNDIIGKNPKPFDFDLPMVMIAQLKGSMQVFLKPHALCTPKCETISEVLKEGEILLVTDLLWSVQYLPGGLEESIAVAVGATFD